MSRFLITVATISLLCHLASSQASSLGAHQETLDHVSYHVNTLISPLLCQIASNLQITSAEVDKLCVQCPGGSYKGKSGSCERCPAGKFAARGAARCTDCPAGKFSEAGQEECKLCPAGTFSATPGSQQCSKCKSEFQYSDPGSSSCKDCDNAGLSSDGVCLKKVRFASCSAPNTYPGYPCANAMDGIRYAKNNIYYCSLTTTGERYWRGDLASSMVVKKVTVSGYQWYIQNIMVFALSGTEWISCGKPTITDTQDVVFNCNRMASAIKVDRSSDTGYLGPGEVEVWV